MSAAVPSVFISYRREGTAMHAGRLYDGVAGRFGEDAVFMDLEMAPGIDFVDRITTVVGACRALLVVIGPQWAHGGPTSSRLADPTDFVRLEVETALRAPDVTVIPVLVAGARMPAAEELPPPLQPLVRRNAVELTDLKWRYDCTRLMAALDQLLAEPEPEPEPELELEPATPPRPRRARTPRERGRLWNGTARAGASVRALLPLWLEGLVVALAAGMLTRALMNPQSNPQAGRLEHVLPLVERRAVAWAAVTAVLVLWMCLRRGERERLVRRAAAGLLLGALGGALGGIVYGGLVVLLPDAPVVPPNTAAVLSLAVTGAVVGGTVGGLWIPRRIVVGLASGALGGTLSTLVANTLGHPPGVLALGLDCFAIVGLALLALMALDVRAAALPQRALGAPAPAPARA